MKNRVLKITFGAILLALIVLQFIPDKLPANNDDTSNDLITASGQGISSEVAGLLKSSCYDCHSNQVHYPWYSYVAPVSWLIRSDVEEGREELNFSEWNTYNKRRKIRKLEEIRDEVAEGEMPLGIYTAIHRDAALSKEQQQQIVAWTEEMSARILE